MNWIDDDLQELQRQREAAAELLTRESQIGRASGQIFEDLWQQILRDIAEAKTKGLPSILTNGMPFERKLIVPVKPKPPQTSTYPNEITVKRTSDQQAIVVSGPSISLHFGFSIGTDNVARLKYDGEEITIPEAARLILRPLLFPELFMQK